MPGYLMLFPLLGNWAQDFRPRLRDTVALISAGLLGTAGLFLAAELSLGFIPNLNRAFAPGKSPLLQAVDWDSIATQLPPGIDAIAAQKWFDAGKIGYALRDEHLPVTVFGVEPHQFEFSAPPSSLLGKTVLVIAMPGSTSATAAKFAGNFKSFVPGPALTVMHQGDVLLVIPTFIGTDLIKAP